MPSQTGSGYYVTKLDKCTCPDWETHGRGHKCKHIYAVEIIASRRTDADGSVTEIVHIKKKSYTQPWKEYNEAQTEEEPLFRQILRNLVEDVPDQPQTMGRPKVPLKDMAYCAIDKVYSTKSCRVTENRIVEAAQRQDISRDYHFNTASIFMNTENANFILNELLLKSALPLVEIDKIAAIDSTGFSTNQFCQYAVERFHAKRNHHWLKAHAVVGCKTHAILAVKITGEQENAGDSPHFEPLVSQAKGNGFQFDIITADKAYNGRKNSNVSELLGIKPYIPFRSNATGRARGSAAYRRDYLFWAYHAPEFEATYHQRSNIEATFGAIKAKFTDRLRSKNQLAQKNELMCKFIAYNICMLIKAMKMSGVYPEWLHLNSDSCINSDGGSGL